MPRFSTPTNATPKVRSRRTSDHNILTSEGRIGRKAQRTSREAEGKSSFTPKAPPPRKKSSAGWGGMFSAIGSKSNQSLSFADVVSAKVTAGKLRINARVAASATPAGFGKLSSTEIKTQIKRLSSGQSQDLLASPVFQVPSTVGRVYSWCALAAFALIWGIVAQVQLQVLASYADANASPGASGIFGAYTPTTMAPAVFQYVLGFGLWCDGDVDAIEGGYFVWYILIAGKSAFMLAIAGLLLEAFVQTFGGYMQYAVLKYGALSDHAIIVGTSPECVRLARELNQRMSTVLICTDTDMPEMELLMATGVHVVRGVSIDEGVLDLVSLKTAKICFAFGDKQAENVSLAYKIATYLDDLQKASGIPPNQADRLTTWVRVHRIGSSRINMGDILEGANTPGQAVEIFDLERAASRVCLKRHAPWGPLSPPIDTRDPRVHNLVVGFGNLGESIVHQLIKIAHFADERAVMITIIEKDPVKVGRFHHFMSRFQNLTKVAEFNLVQEDPLAVTADMWAAQANNSHLYCIYICLNLDQAIASTEVAMHFNLLVPDKERTNVVVCVKSLQDGADVSVFNHFRKQSNIAFFGVHDHVVSADAIFSSDMDLLAKIIYDTYRNEWAQDAPVWEKISYADKEPNRESADHMDVKKGMLEKLTGLPNIVYDVPRIRHIIVNNRDDCLESLSKVEHRRWVASKLLQGWQHAYIDEQNRETKEHPCLIGYDMLPPDEKEKDRKMMRAVPELLKTQIIGQMKLLDRLDKKRARTKDSMVIHNDVTVNVIRVMTDRAWQYTKSHLLLLVVANVAYCVVTGSIASGTSPMTTVSEWVAEVSTAVSSFAAAVNTSGGGGGVGGGVGVGVDGGGVGGVGGGVGGGGSTQSFADFLIAGLESLKA